MSYQPPPRENSVQALVPPVLTEQPVRALPCAKRNTGTQHGPSSPGAHRLNKTGKARTLTIPSQSGA